MGQWEHDRFATNTTSGPGSSGTGQQQERSTIAQWRAFAQSHTSQPLPPLRGNVGNDDARWNEKCRVGFERTRPGVGCQGQPALPTHPTLPTLPPALAQGQHQTSRGPSRVYSGSRSYELPPPPPRPVPQDQVQRKRKSESCSSQYGETSGNAPQAKRCSPDRPIPPSATFAGNVNNGVAATEGTHPLPRRPGFKTWVSSRERPHMVAPNGTTIIPTKSQPRKAVPQCQTLVATTVPQLTAQDNSIQKPEIQPGKPDLTPTVPTSPLQSPSFPLQTTANPNPSKSTLPGASTPKATSNSSSPPKSRPKTNDDAARRLIFAGIGVGRVPKRTEEEIKKREEEQDKRRIQREERENLGREEMLKWRGVYVAKPQVRTVAQVSVKQEAGQLGVTRVGGVKMTRFHGEEIQW